MALFDRKITWCNFVLQSIQKRSFRIVYISEIKPSKPKNLDMEMFGKVE